MSKKTKYKEPAQIGYFFSGSYADLWHTIKTAWSDNFDKISDSAGEIAECWGDRNVYSAICLTLFKAMILASVAIFGTIFTAVFSLAHIAILFVIMVFVYIGFMFLKLVDMIYCAIKRIGNNCYNPGCERKFTHPVYLCPNPNCRAQHRKLVPSRYGIFKRRCKCGTRIPTTFINGRQHLDSLCPHCFCEALKGVHTNLLIPVVGGASSGKTCFVSMAIEEIGNKAANYGLEYKYQFVQGDAYQDNMKRMNAGHVPQKTGDMAFKYYNFYLKPQNAKIDNLISVCDIAGEVFTNQDAISGQQGYRFADGIVLVVDPLSITEYSQELKKKLGDAEFNKFNGSAQPMSDVLTGLINTMESLYHKKATESINASVVIVFTKNDIPGLDDEIGRAAVSKYMSKNGKAGECEAYNAVCEKFLIDNGESSFLNTVKGKFKSVQFFSCSALGHNETGEAFEPKDVEKPLFWIIDKMNKSLDLSAVWKKR